MLLNHLTSHYEILPRPSVQVIIENGKHLSPFLSISAQWIIPHIFNIDWSVYVLLGSTEHNAFYPIYFLILIGAKVYILFLDWGKQERVVACQTELRE